MNIQNTLTPYDTVDNNGGILYGNCRDFDHISRYRGLRSITHNPDLNEDRFVTLETPNPFSSNVDVKFYTVKSHEENRLDIIANRFLGTSNYAWVIAYINNIEDGFTIKEGMKLKIPNSISDLFNSGELLQSVSPTLLNLGSE